MPKPQTTLNPLMTEKYTRAGFWKNQTLCDYFQDLLKRNPEKIAIVEGEHRLSFRDIEFLSNNLARSLRTLGIGRGDVVSFQLPNWYQAAVLNVALTKLGTVVNPIIPIYRTREVRFILSQSHSAAIFIPDVFRGFDYVEMIRELRPDLPHLRHVIVLGKNVPEGMIAMDRLLEGDGSSVQIEAVDPNDVKLVIYTSGTTAEPKGVQHTHNTLVRTALHDTRFTGLDENTVTFMPSPVTHITGYCQALEFPFIVGLRAVLMDKWDPEEGLKIIEKEECNYTVGATPFLQHIIQSPGFGQRSIRSPFTFLCGGAYIPPELIREACQKTGWKTYRVYGSTETPTISLGMGPVDKAAETDGMVVDYEIRILDSENRPRPFGEEGEIVVRGSKLFVGYTAPELNREAFDEGGWFHTGDLGRLSPDGYLQITGRKKDIIIRGGENISAAEIEDVLHLHPSIETAAAVAMPDQKLGEKVCAYVRLKKGMSMTFEEMIEFVSGHQLAKQKWPERLELIDEFPMTASGKIKKHVLRRNVAEKLGLPAVR
jgi:cyclohexanecarboxylate-CoA ligase